MRNAVLLSLVNYIIRARMFRGVARSTTKFCRITSPLSYFACKTLCRANAIADTADVHASQSQPIRVGSIKLGLDVIKSHYSVRSLSNRRFPIAEMNFFACYSEGNSHRVCLRYSHRYASLSNYKSTLYTKSLSFFCANPFFRA